MSMARIPAARRSPATRATQRTVRPEEGTKLTREQKKERTRARLVAAGVRLITEQGIFASSLEAIAEAAGLTKGAIYSNFGSKADFFCELFDKVFSGEVVSPAAADDPELLATEFLSHLRIDPAYWRRMLEAAVYVTEDPELRRVVLEARFRRYGLAPMEGPEDERWHGTAVEAVGGGIAIVRLLYGEDYLPDELVRWMFKRMME